LSQVGRVSADHCLRVFVVLKTAASGAGERESAWHFVVALFALPAVFLTPLIGAVGNSLPKRWVLAGAAAWCLGVLLAFAPAAGAWFWCLGFLAVGSALYGPVRYAMLPAAARDTHIPLPRVNGIIEMGTVAAIVGGMILGGVLYGEASPPPFEGLHGTIAAAAEQFVPTTIGTPPAMLAALALSVIALLAALPASFTSDVRRAEAAALALKGFFHDSKRILRRADTRGTLLAWSAFRGLVAAVTGAFVADILTQEARSGEAAPFQALLGTALWIMAGAAGGSLLASFQGHPRRSLGLVPLALSGLLAALAWAAAVSLPGSGLCVVVGALGGLVNVPLSAAYQEGLPADARGNGLALLHTAGYVMMTAMGLLMFSLARSRVLSATGQLWFVAVLAALGVALAWRVLFRDSLEQLIEIALWPIYRIHAYGPGKESCPRRGPLLVVANHTSWMDPLWLAKVVPRRVTPMMTSVFFDLPGLRWLMTHVVHAIRVQASTFRRDAPELREAIAALDRGECVVIFPEGMLRRRPDLNLRQFGQGVWHILNARPPTPVLVCWIEGGWGSYMSYFNGPPLVNKKPDFWRRIDIGIAEPLVLEAGLLADDRTTRSYLMRVCLEARRFLGLEPLEVTVQVKDEVPLTEESPGNQKAFEQRPDPNGGT
jgi:1-acyl-sn-glycerol-3-phosphate acyltransferase